MSAVTNGNDVFDFLLQYDFWDIRRSSSGRIEIVVRSKSGEYVKIWSRKNESVFQAIDRAKRDVGEVDNA